MREYDNRQICGTCKYHRKEPEDAYTLWYCDCDFGEYDGEYTEYDDTCDDWEGR